MCGQRVPVEQALVWNRTFVTSKIVDGPFDLAKRVATMKGK
jgi:hypothetical protein